MPEEIETIDVEPRKYRWVEFGDGVDGKVLASSLSEDGSKRLLTVEIDERILRELILTKRLNTDEIIEDTMLKLEIPNEFCTEINYLTSNPKIRADCDFRGKPIPGITSKYQTALKNANEQIRSQELQIFDLQSKLRKATSDIERFVKENWQSLAKPYIDDLKSVIPRQFPVTRIKKRSLEPV